ncbi:hypothetical protein GCM10025865_27270 [Paraoerskovia sediminicola]|uniref:Uncharacterized protein n=2 Tax=Paraoerskovia sediminicola TaxID=1138587 RepID=A0ABN6XH67_9CELL|nr:hypothetical protein GCM10025865_27270 [Paraoerskovia sediminicola]
MTKERGFWSDERTATHQDLAGLFIARAVERYLKAEGHFGFVVPNSVVDRDYWEGFRSGRFDTGTRVTFTPSWDLRRLRPHLFPRGSAVVFGRRTAIAEPMPADLEVWAGRAPVPHALAGAPLDTITRTPGHAVSGTGSTPGSKYADRFSNGANLFPRLLFRVEPDSATTLGAPAGRRSVRSQRTVSEKAPWKNLAPLTGAVEAQFIWPTVLGEHVLPFRVMPPAEFVVPLRGDGTLLATPTEFDRWPGLAAWMRQATELWNGNQTGKLTLAKQIDHMKKLTQQAPMPSTRVVYAASGMHVAAAVLTDSRTVIEHGAYWASVSSPDEAAYLVGILNSPSLTELVRPYMSYGKDERHVDKNVWKLPIASYDHDNLDHIRVVELSNALSSEIAALQFTSSNFVVRRRIVRAHIAQSLRGKELDSLVADVVHE